MLVGLSSTGAIGADVLSGRAAYAQSAVDWFNSGLKKAKVVIFKEPLLIGARQLRCIHNMPMPITIVVLQDGNQEIKKSDCRLHQGIRDQSQLCLGLL